jgi:CBS domain containing-hemolysin-like protein
MSSEDVLLLVVAVVLIVLASLLAGLDAAINRVSRVTVDGYVREERRGALRLQSVLTDPARYVNVGLFLQTIAEITAIVLVTVVTLNVFDQRWEAVLISSASMVVIAYVIVGVAPRTLGRQHSGRIALAGAGVLYSLATFLAPLTKVLILLGNALTPGRGFRDGPFTTEAELRDLVDLAEEHSLIQDDERQMIHSVFELGETIAREVMVPRTDMVFIERHKTLRQALSLGLRSGFSRIPVIGENEDDIVGIIYLKDVTRRIYDHREGESIERVESLMRPASFVPESRAADGLLRDMQARRTHIAIVVDEYGGVAGLVTIEDVLEEIVGEIADEYDVEEVPQVIELADGGYRVNSRMHVEELSELLDVQFDEEDLEDVDTVGGLLAKRLGKVPIPGATADVNGLQLTADTTAGRRNRIGSITVRRLAPRSVPSSVEEANGA